MSLRGSYSAQFIANESLVKTRSEYFLTSVATDVDNGVRLTLRSDDFVILARSAEEKMGAGKIQARSSGYVSGLGLNKGNNRIDHSETFISHGSRISLTEV